MQTDYLKQARSFLAQNTTRLALRAIPMALVAVAAAHAAPTFNAPTTSITTNTCSGGSSAGSLAGTAANGEISLSGSATLTNSAIGNCTMLMTWKGTGSGSLASASYSSTFTIALTGNGYVTGYNLTISIDGVAQTPVTCSSYSDPSVYHTGPSPRGYATNCAGTFTVPITNIPASGVLTSYEADLSVSGFWANTNTSTLSVSVPTGSTIDIFATSPVTATVPALSPVALAGTALLLALAAFRMASWKNSSRGAPGPQA